ncbi:ABC transporter ATP-binding protein [Agromyces subbeticus]|uniref:ABC transporter ATP-binding protein n=1 Tax=Agromyces subbeticus TaxID=293890 RepID=UPI00041500BD|nr:ABC transporter ATP-binding protein [Agromyces subbeticus]
MTDEVAALIEPTGVDAVSFRGATRYYPKSDVAALDGFDLEVSAGEFMVLVGPSGSGKSTALRMLAGLEGVDAGSIHIGDVDVTHLPPIQRDIAMVFQDYALYPHMTVAENIGFHLKVAKVSRAEITARVNVTAEMLGLTPYLGRRPAALSGGQRQRVAMGRAIIRRPKVFLMDEPLSNLDAKLRTQTRNEIARLQRDLGITTIYVTHDQVEAMTMGDRVAVLRDGALQQCDRPKRLYQRPANTFVATFMGTPSMALLDAHLDGEAAALPGHAPIALTREQRAALTGGHVIVGVRPDAVSVVPAGQGIPGTVEVIEELGNESFLYVRAELAGQSATIAVQDRDGVMEIAPGAMVGLRVSPDMVHLFDGGTGLRLPD